MNIDAKVVEGFGEEWARFDQAPLSEEELRAMFDHYFDIFPWDAIDSAAVGFDLGCGSGRWARLVAPRVGRLHLIDPSARALDVARRNLAGNENCDFHCAGVDAIPLADGSADFGYSLGVLHHLPDTQAGIEQCARKLKPGAPFLLYLYYAFDNRPAWFRLLWRCSDGIRRVVSRLPFSVRHPLCQIAAALVYWPLARLSLVLEHLGADVGAIPLSQYRHRSFYVMRTDARDRFGTRLERRFTKDQMRRMMERAGLREIAFSQTSFWTAVARKM